MDFPIRTLRPFLTTHPFVSFGSSSLWRAACRSPSAPVMIATGAAACEGVPSGIVILAILGNMSALEGLSICLSP